MPNSSARSSAKSEGDNANAAATAETNNTTPVEPTAVTPVPKDLQAADPFDAQAALAEFRSDMRQAAAAETRRIAAIRKLCAGEHAEIEAKAIDEGWDLPRCELEVLRTSRPSAPAGQRDRLESLVAGWWPVKTTTTMQPAERFEKFYALRAWCEAAGHAQAVKALDGQVLPTIVRDAAKEGGPTT